MIRWASSLTRTERRYRCHREIFTASEPAVNVADAESSGAGRAGGAPAASPSIVEFRAHSKALLAAVVGLCVGLPGLSNYGFSAFIAPLTREFGWSISDVSAWVFFLMLGSCATSVFLGSLVDRFGARAAILCCIPIFSCALGSAAFMTGNIWQLRGAAFLAGAIGPGTSLLAYSQVINERFSAARGTALGLMTAGIGASSMFAPPLMQRIADTYGWRAAFMFMGAASFVAFPFAYFWLRDKLKSKAPSKEPHRIGFTRIEALRAPIFWMIGGIAFIVGLYSAGVIFNLLPFLTETGLSRQTAASYLGMFGLFMVLGKLACGLTLDKFPVFLIGAVILAAQSAALICLGLYPGKYAVIAIAVVGFSTGGQIACSTYCIARYLGMRSYGQVYGILSIIGSVGVGLGPYLFSSLRELAMDYRLSLSAAGGLALLAGALYGTLRRYQMCQL
jgi:predicted MFS family arabinose efflux permease